MLYYNRLVSRYLQYILLQISSMLYLQQTLLEPFLATMFALNRHVSFYSAIYQT